MSEKEKILKIRKNSHSEKLFNFFFKEAFVKKKINIILLMYLNKILNLFLSTFFFNLKKLNNIKDKNFDYSVFILKTSFSKKNLIMLKHLSYLIKQKKYNNKFFLLQKKFFLVLFSVVE